MKLPSGKKFFKLLTGIQMKERKCSCHKNTTKTLMKGKIFLGCGNVGQTEMQHTAVASHFRKLQKKSET